MAQNFTTNDEEIFFFSTYAQVLISSWENLLALIQEYSKTGKTKIPNNEQIKEALEHALDLLKENFNAIATYQKAITTLNKKRELINGQLELIAKTTQAIIENPDKPAGVPLAQLEEQSKDITAKQTIIKNLIIQTGSLGAGLNDLMKQHEATWKELQTHFGSEAIAKLEKALGITFSDLEKNELISPTKSKDELISELEKFNLLSTIKNPKKASFFELRLYWLIGAAQGRTATTIDIKQATKTIAAIKNEKIIAETDLLRRWQQTYEKQNNELQKFEREAKGLLGLPPADEEKISAQLALLQKPSGKVLPFSAPRLEDLIQVTPE